MNNKQSVLLTRGIKQESGWFGLIDVLGIDHRPIVSLELPWRKNAKEISCIPAGSYECVPHARGWWLQNVPNRTEVLIHSANTTADLRGCIAPGLTVGLKNNVPAVLQSKLAIEELRKLIKGTFILTIR